MFFNLAFCLLVWQDKFGRALKTMTQKTFPEPKINLKFKQKDPITKEKSSQLIFEYKTVVKN